jgi:hypothetical protein
MPNPSTASLTSGKKSFGTLDIAWVIQEESSTIRQRTAPLVEL